MAVCRKCKKSFHACGNCGLLHDWEYHYCSETCWKESRQYKEGVEKIERVANALSFDLREDLLDMVDVYNDFWVEFDNALGKKRR